MNEGLSAGEWSAAVDAVEKLPADASVLLVCHVNPDGDAIGSMLGVGLGLRSLGFRAVQATFPGAFQGAGTREGPGTGGEGPAQGVPDPAQGVPDPAQEVPEPFAALPGLELLVPAAEAAPAPDLMMCFDAASVSRLGELADRVATAGVTVVLDHHASYTGFGTVHLVDPQAAATAVVADGLLERLGVGLDSEVAECLYVALATDTGSFKFGMTTPAVHQLAARLLATGIDPAEISRRVFDTRPFGAVRLYGEVLTRTQLDQAAAGGHGLVWTYTTLADLARHGQRPYVLEPLIDAVRCTAEADVSCVVKEVAAGEWAVSMRSKGASDVSAVAVALGGGGHRLAAGFTGYGELVDVVDAIRAKLAGQADQAGHAT